MVGARFIGAVAALAACAAAVPTPSPKELAQELDLLMRNPNVTVEDIENIEKRQHSYFPITGIPDNQIRVRYPIQTLADDFPDQFTLFVLGLQDFQSIDQSQMLSYYQLTGIHGVPNVAWDGRVGTGGGTGYCEHSSILFPTWHRAFVSLFEQQWKISVNRVVSRYPAGARRQRYAAAAATIRFPYLDWANKPSNYIHVVPHWMTDQYLSLDTPNGVQNVFNPLFRYTFHPLNPSDMEIAPYTSWTVTFRYPTSENPADAANTFSQNNLMINAFDAPNTYNGLRQNVYNMFTLCPEFTEFSNDRAASSTPNCHTSLESIHDGVHNLAGGFNHGHMTYLWWSHFDPFFWLHHMNVERLFAMWQAVNKNSYYDYSMQKISASYAYPAGALLDINSALYPFSMDTAGNLWRPNNIYNHRTFHSTFPEFVNWDGNSATMRAIVNRLYGSTASGAASKRKNKRSILSSVDGTLSGAVNGHISQIMSGVGDLVNSTIGDLTNSTLGDITSAADGAMAPLSLLTTPQGKRYEYIVNIKTPRFALGDSYNVFCFLGQPTTTDTTKYFTDDNMVGFVAAFSMPGMQGAATDDLIAGSVPLTNALVNLVGAKKLGSMSVSDVTAFLNKELSWQVVGADGTVFNNADVPGLSVAVVNSDVTPAASEFDFPTWSTFNALPDITHGKAGGVLNSALAAFSGTGHAIDQAPKPKTCKSKRS